MRSLSKSLRAVFFQGLVVATALGLGACSSSPSNTTVVAPPMAPDASSFNATWKPDTIILDDATVKASLRNPTTTDGIYQFDPSLAQVASMKPGQALLLTGVDLVKVDTVDVQAGVIVVTTEPASLLDAATDANVSWDIGADMSKGPPSDMQSFVPRLGIQAAPTVVDCEGDAGPCSSKLTFSGMLGNLTAKQTFSFSSDGSMKMVAKLTYQDPKTGNIKLDTAVSVTVKSFRHQGSIVIQGGAVQQASVGLKDLDVDLEVAFNGDSIAPSDTAFSLPIQFSFPFFIGPVPAYFTTSGSIALNPSLAGGLVKAKLKHHVGGDIGFSIAGTTIVGTGSLDSAPGEDPVVSDTAAVCTVTAGMGMLTEFPKVAFGVGIAKVVTGEVYLVGKEELVANDVVNFDQNGFIVGNCLTVNGDTGAYYGGSFRLLSLSFKQEKEIYGRTRQVFQGGNPSAASQCK